MKRKGQKEKKRMNQILLMMDTGDHFDLLYDALSSQYGIVLPNINFGFSHLYFDLCIISIDKLEHCKGFIEERKKSEMPVIVPFLCIVDSEMRTDIKKLLSEGIVDEMITAPIQTPELMLRIRHLLKLRGQSKKLKYLKEEK